MVHGNEVSMEEFKTEEAIIEQKSRENNMNLNLTKEEMGVLIKIRVM